MLVPHKIPLAHKYPWAVKDTEVDDEWCWGMFKTETEAQEACDRVNAARRPSGFKRFETRLFNAILCKIRRTNDHC